MQDFNPDIINNYRLSKEKEISLWKNAVFIFDSSALLDFYSIPKSTRKKIYEEIFEKLPKRLWIPNHVQYEFLKNRESVIRNTAKSKYKFVDDTSSNLSKSIKGLLNKVEDLSQRTQNDLNHPYIEQSDINSLKTKVNDFVTVINEHEEKIKKQLNDAKQKILNLEFNDDVLKALKNNFKTGREFKFKEILEITKEGKHRFQFKIPPGYGDLNNEKNSQKQKKGTQIFGDLIIWKQILEFSKKDQRPVIFVLNDITKEDDWCYLENNSKQDVKVRPREELIKEIKDHSGVDFWMYSLTQFLKIIIKDLKTSIDEEIVEAITEHLDEYRTHASTHEIVYNWIKQYYGPYSTNIIQDLYYYPQVTLDYPEMARGFEIKNFKKINSSTPLIEDMFKRALIFLKKGETIDEFYIVLVAENKAEAYLLFENAYRIKQQFTNNTIYFIVGYIHNNNSFLPINS